MKNEINFTISIFSKFYVDVRAQCLTPHQTKMKKDLIRKMRGNKKGMK